MKKVIEREVRIIAVPLDLGASRRGTDVGPSALRIAGLGAQLRRLGYSVAREEDIPAPAMEIVELNPFLDHRNISAERTLQLILSAMGKSIL